MEDGMDTRQQKVMQYLDEAHASEMALTRVLQSQLAMTPRGSYRSTIETHLRETRDHARRLERRLGELGAQKNPVQAVNGAAQAVVGQALALAKTPIDLLRGTGGDEKVLKNARDSAATEALEIATYTSIERAARAAGDDTTAALALSIRADEERMLERVLEEIPKLTAAVVGDGDGGAPTEPWPGYDKEPAGQIVSRLAGASGSERARVRAYERAHKRRRTVLEATERAPAGR
jgi:ferritin-like metal-binding protein YciE